MPTAGSPLTACSPSIWPMPALNMMGLTYLNHVSHSDARASPKGRRQQRVRSRSPPRRRPHTMQIRHEQRKKQQQQGHMQNGLVCATRRLSGRKAGKGGGTEQLLRWTAALPSRTHHPHSRLDRVPGPASSFRDQKIDHPPWATRCVKRLLRKQPTNPLHTPVGGNRCADSSNREPEIEAHILSSTSATTLMKGEGAGTRRNAGYLRNATPSHTHSQRPPPGSLWPKDRVKPWITGSPNLFP